MTTVVDALYLVCLSSPTKYVLSGKQLHLDEVYALDGFMPLLARFAQARIERILPRSGLSIGFQMSKHKAAILGETLSITTGGEGFYSDAERLSMLHAASRELLGNGLNAVVDLTPVCQAYLQAPEDIESELASGNFARYQALEVLGSA